MATRTLLVATLFTVLAAVQSSAQISASPLEGVSGGVLEGVVESLPATPPDAVGAPAPQAPAQNVRRDLPAWLPNYHLDVALDTNCRNAKVVQEVTWTNPAHAVTDQLVFHVYPRHRPDPKLMEVYRRTLESLRVDPRDGLDPVGGRSRVLSVFMDDRELDFSFDPKIDTLMYVQLPVPVAPGESVTVTMEWELTIPEVQGRLGQWNGVTAMLNWYPILAYFGDQGWDNAPYIAWHQPWLNEAGNYTVNLKLPADQMVAASGFEVDRRVDDQGWQYLTLVGEGIRDFAIVASARFENHETNVNGVRVRVLAFPEHRRPAQKALETAAESIALYSELFGPYQHPEFKVTEAYFGWNGNETSGMILIDERVFDTPGVGYKWIEHLVSHETAHQWWYSTVGTDGFRQTFMDEGLVVFITEWKMKRKYGKDFNLFDWPKWLSWLPNIRYNTLQHTGYYLYRSRGGNGVVISPLPEFEHVHNVFFLPYDRGSKVFWMIQQRMGEEQFWAFLRTVYQKHKYKILSVEQFQADLEEFTGESWESFFHDWLRTPKIADWKVEGVWIDACNGGHQTRVRIRQTAGINEQIEVGYQFEVNGPIVGKITVVPEAGDYTFDNASVRRIDDCNWDVTFVTRERPVQVVIDPDHNILDADMTDNRWKKWPELSATPFYTPLDEIGITRPLDRPSFRAGPGIDEYGRLVARGSYFKPNEYRVSPYLAYSPIDNDNRLAAGFDGIIFNALPNVSVGARYEHHLASDLFNDPVDQGKLFVRWNQAYTSSSILPNPLYVEGYFRFGDNYFLPGHNPREIINPAVRPPTAPGVENYRDIRALGLKYHADARVPYWMPYTGFALDANYEHGFQAFGNGESYNRVWSQVSAVREFPCCMGWLSKTKLAGRLAGGVGSPDNGEHFRLGGQTELRGQRSEDTEGSMFWLASAEWRFPIWYTDYPIFDNIVNLRSIHGTVFYDVGEMYLNSNSLGVDHTVGGGIYLDMPVLSILETLGLRLEVGHSLSTGTTVTWFGTYHAF